jgi:hypothetical protein
MMHTTTIRTRFATIPAHLCAAEGLPVPSSLHVEGLEIVATYDNGFVLRCASMAVLRHVTGLCPDPTEPAFRDLREAHLDDLEWERSYPTKRGVIG